MRRFIVGVAAAVTLAFSGAANAAVTVTSSTNLTDPNPCCGTAPGNTSIATQADGTTTITFGQNGTGLNFTSSFIFMNTVGGLYNFFVGTSTDGTIFNNVVVSGGTLATTTVFAPPPASVIQQFGIPLLANTAYTVTIGGTSTNESAAISGNITIHPAAVPEPATWAMMLLGFAGMGMAVRRHRRPMLTQLA